ncbi:FAD-binding oxidoreductase [Cyanobium sp. CH-040]|uniref:NAD(P)/FAD-dependent oxidoreductase n=1 Tax=Cyanobium sp. CH-040 TaxID=2823708 RepID=UPI0020CC1A91|nr:FAD-dependent oxidoreductase [Cyanobium sp. CH-040]MCP9927065.1 FAD-binding oxidoreductase [Cyanobium sp. CH-040]
MLVVGGGIIGLSIAWLLQRRGHRVVLVDPSLDGPPAPGAGSQAALGVLMAQVFHRSSGRVWRLRQRSHSLWQQWIAGLEAEGHRLPRRRGLLLLAADAAEQVRQQRLAAGRAPLGLPLSLRSSEQLRALRPELPAAALGGLHSAADGQLDPPSVMAALLASARAGGLRTLALEATGIERRGGGWRLRCGDGTSLDAPWLVLCAGVATPGLLAGAGHDLPMEPVRGQALELELDDGPGWSEPGSGWPGVVVWRGLNLVPRPDLPGGRRCWLGATLEPGGDADPRALEDLRGWAGAELPWLQRATVVHHWQGERCRPVRQPAPVLESPEPGLLVASGHYRNGVLLAPATAEWVAERIEGAPA